VVVSKKVDKRAVVRNTIRRRVVSALADLLQDGLSGDVVVVVHNKQVLETQFDELKKQLASSIQ
jgi:ribonuclease P protein component